MNRGFLRLSKIVTSYFYCLTFAIYCLFATTCVLTLLFFLISNNLSFLHITFNILSLDSINLESTYLMTKSSLVFSICVLVIRTGIYVYSHFYLETCWKRNYYRPLLLTFIGRMLYTINCNSLFFIILGWDGLGFRRYLLVCYYINPTCLNNGLFTLLTNRFGDIFFIWFIIFTLSTSPSTPIKIISALPLILGLSTKSAIFPFRSWLPAAISAPTPVRALVHRRTLVTRGLWLMIRNYYYLTINPILLKLLRIIRLFTIFFSGLNTILELDIKKLIALRTLRHIGFICLGVSLGLVRLAFTHLLVHAIFKRLLFIAIGIIIISNSHYQDIRFLRRGTKISPLRSTILSTRILRLLGIPITRGFFSKDLILEASSYSNSSWLLELFLYCSTLFSFYYSIKLFSFSTSNPSSRPFKLHTPTRTCLLIFLLSIILLNLFFFKLIMTILPMDLTFFPPVTTSNKLTLFGLIVFICCLWYFKTNIYPSNKPGYSFFSSIINLSFVRKSLISTASFLVISNISPETHLKKIQLLDLRNSANKLSRLICSIPNLTNLYVILTLGIVTVRLI